MNKSFLAAAIAFTASSFAGVSPTPKTPTTACLGPDVFTDVLRQSILIVAMTNASWADTLRARSHVPALTDSTAVAVVSDSAQCANALTVYNAQARVGRTAATDIYLLRVGPVFVASNPNDGTGRSMTEQIVMDSTLTHIGGFLR
jgi:hypothetical protein